MDENKIKFFQDKLLKWFKSNQRLFPWRKKNLNNYQIIISEILLQRTKAETVSKFYDQFIVNFPNWKTLSNTELALLENSLKPIGLQKQRAARLKKLAEYMVKNRGRLPKNRGELENIPFMGQYIANAVDLFIHKINKPLLDVNMARVLERFFGERIKADIRYDEYLQKLSFEVVQHKKVKEINWAILDFAAIICIARNPKCKDCFLKSACIYFEKYKNTT